jgi:hypothetical protein
LYWKKSDIFVAGTKLLRNEDIPAASGERAQNIAKSKVLVEQYDKAKQKMKTWITNENSITIKCSRYTYVVLALCAIIIAGGLAIPFIVKDRIIGVDPFQITTFAWLIVGVILVSL